MSAERQYKISCDYGNCGDWIICKVETLAKARAEARRSAGWSTFSGRDYCRRHFPLGHRRRSF